MSGADAAYDNIGKALTQVATLAQSQLAAATRMALEVATKGVAVPQRLRLAA
ncbi:MAG: hypothetical protein JNJ60_14045 [Rhodocyclaceae bacterium]|nr:hypothetical protein [Rhodocyclaceae bacterium]